MFEYMHVWTGIASLICIFCIQYVNKHLCFHIKDASTPIKTSLNGNQLQLVLDHSANFTQNHATCDCSPVATFVSPVQLPVFLQSFCSLSTGLLNTTYGCNAVPLFSGCPAVQGPLAITLRLQFQDHLLRPHCHRCPYCCYCLS